MTQVYTQGFGVGGLDSTHTWRADEGGLRFAGYHQWASQWWLKVDKIAGLFSLGELEDQTQPSEGRVGKVKYPALTGGKTITYEGRLIAKTLPQLRLGAATFRKWLMGPSMTRDGPMNVLALDAPGGGYRYDGRIMQADMDDEQELGGNARPTIWQRKFIVGILQTDPRYYWYPQQAHWFGAGDNVGTMTNNGTADTLPKIGIYGPLDDLHVINATLNKRLAFTDLGISGGERLVINFQQRSVFTPSVAYPGDTPNTLLFDKMDFANSDWWDPFVEGLGSGTTQINLSLNTTHGGWYVFYSDAAW